MKTIAMGDLVRVGESFFSIQNPQFAYPLNYAHEVSLFFEALKACGLTATLSVAQSLSGFATSSKIPDEDLQRFSEQNVNFLKACSQNIRNALQHDLTDKQLVVLQQGLVSARLRNLPNVITLTPTQDALLQESIRCFEVEAYRAAMVMGWNLAYEIVRWWAFQKHPTEVESYRLQLYPKKSEITKYEDLFASEKPLGEFEFLQVLRGPSGQKNIIPVKIVNDLEHYLRLRNNYAHPNFTIPSASKANGYIEYLLDIIETYFK